MCMNGGASKSGDSERKTYHAHLMTMFHILHDVLHCDEGTLSSSGITIVQEEQKHSLLRKA